MRDVRVLVVNDDSEFSESLAMAIGGRGHGVDVALNGILRKPLNPRDLIAAVELLATRKRE